MVLFFLYKKAEVTPQLHNPPSPSCPPARHWGGGGSAEVYIYIFGGKRGGIWPFILERFFLAVYLLCAEARGVSTEKPPGSDGSS